MDEGQEYNDPDFASQFFLKLNEHRQSQRLTDLVICTSDGIDFHCHKIVLASVSPYFEAMFQSGMVECRNKIIDLSSVDSEAFQYLLDYMYTSKVVICASNAQSLMQAADLLNLIRLKEACEKYMCANVSECNCIGMYQLATLYKMDHLQTCAKQTMLSDFSVVSKENEFLELEVEDLLQYICDENLTAEREDLVLLSVMEWAIHNPDERAKHLEHILTQGVRLLLCSSEVVFQVLSDYDEILRDSKCNKLMYQVQKQYYNPIVKHTELLHQSRKCYKYVMVMGGSNDKGEYNTSCMVLSKHSTWKKMTETPYSYIQQPGMCLIRNSILITGGWDGQKTRNQCWLFNIRESTWQIMPQLREKKYRHQAVYLPEYEKVFLFGGERYGGEALKMVDYMSTSTKHTWHSGLPMPKGLIFPLAIPLNGHVYVFGGQETSTLDVDSLSLNVYNPLKDSWEGRAPMPKACKLGSALVYNNQIYAVGGFSAACMCYDPSANSWTVLTSPSLSYGLSSAIVWNQKILVLGGNMCENDKISNVRRSCIVLEYDVNSDVWCESTLSLHDKLSSHTAFIVDIPGLGY